MIKYMRNNNKNLEIKSNKRKNKTRIKNNKGFQRQHKWNRIYKEILHMIWKRVKV